MLQSQQSASANKNLGKPTRITSNVRSVIRFRSDGDSTGIEVEKDKNGNKITIKEHEGRNASYIVDHVLDCSATQQETFESVVGDGLKKCLKGQNLCVIAYGQTGSGKTFSMVGTAEEPGIVTRFSDELFERIHAHQATEKVFLTASFYEVYMEKIFDLLVAQRKALQLHSDGNIRGLSAMTVTSSTEVRHLQQRALKQRATAATAFNKVSSRSHSIVEFTIHHETKKPDGGSCVVTGRCIFVDLAGCERMANSVFKQTTANVLMNKSLLTLHCVVENRAGKASYVNYRDSVLTRILQSFFNGNANITVLGTIDPTEFSGAYTLRFVSKAKLIVLCPKVNVSLEKSLNDFPNYDANVWKIDNTEKTSNVHVKRPVGFCVIELLPDTSLHQCHSLQDAITLELFPKNPLVVMNQVDHMWHATALENGVDINNEALQKDSKCQLKHGDCIVLRGKKFFIISLDVQCDYSKFKFDTIKVKYLEATSARTCKIITDRVRAEAEMEFSAVRKQLIEEKAALEAQLEELAKAKKEHSRTHSSNSKKLKTIYEDYVAFEKEFNKFGADVKKPATIDKEPLETAELITEVEILNNACRIEGLNFVSFSVNVKANGGINGVRVADSQTKMHANMTREVFAEFNLLFFNFYNTINNPKDMCLEVKALLFGLDLHWEQESGALSNMVKNMVKTCVKNTADRRNSSVAEVTGRMEERNSFIATMMHSEVKPEKDYEKIFKTTLQYLENSIHDLFKKESTLDLFLSMLHKCFIHLENFGKFDLSTNQKVAACLVNVVRLNTEIMLLGASLAHLLLDSEFNQCSSELNALFTAIPWFHSSFITFFRHATQMNFFEESFTNLKRSCYQVVTAAGALLCYHCLPCPLQFKSLSPYIYQGYMNSVQEDVDEVQAVLKTLSSSTIKGMVCKQTGEIVLAVAPLIGNNENFNFSFYKNGYVPCFNAFKKYMSNSLQSQNPAAFYEPMITLISSDYSTIPKIQEVISMLRDTISYCNAHLNMPNPPVKCAASNEIQKEE